MPINPKWTFSSLSISWLEMYFVSTLPRVSEYKSRDVSKEIYYSVPFLAFKMATVVHTGGKKAEPSVRLV